MYEYEYYEVIRVRGHIPCTKRTLVREFAFGHWMVSVLVVYVRKHMFFRVRIRACADAMFEDARGRRPSDMKAYGRSNRMSVTESLQNRVRINGSTSDHAITPFDAEVSILVRLCAFLAVLAFSAAMMPSPETDIFAETAISRRRRACFIGNASKRAIAGVDVVPSILARLYTFPGVRREIYTPGVIFGKGFAEAADASALFLFGATARGSRRPPRCPSAAPPAAAP